MMQSFEQQSKTEKEEGVKSMKRLNKFKRKVKRISSGEEISTLSVFNNVELYLNLVLLMVKEISPIYIQGNASQQRNTHPQMT